MGRNSGRVAVPRGTVKKALEATINVEDEPEVEDDLLMAMHDLRSVLVRKKAERLPKK